MKIALPWPPRECSPNWRGHWPAKHKAGKRYRKTAATITRVELMANPAQWRDIQRAAGEGAQIHAFIDFYPPDRRQRDDDNLVAAFKAGRDGISDALCIDDRHWRIHPLLRTETRKGGEVVVRLCALATPDADDR